LALSIFRQSQVFQNLRSDSFIVLFGEVIFCSERFGWLSLLVVRGFGKSCFQSLSKSKLCVKVGRVGSGIFFQQSFW